MLTKVIKQTKTAFIYLVLLTALTGLIYPLTITGVAQLFFPHKANGSLLTLDGKIIGSKWIGQSFTSPDFFHGRPSATSPYPYNAKNSAGSNVALSNPLLTKTINDRINQLHHLNPSSAQSAPVAIPIDLVTSSASGLDPDISPAAAYYQVPRIAKARNIPETDLNELVKNHIIQAYASVIGEPRVNVLELNIALLAIETSSKQPEKMDKIS